MTAAPLLLGRGGGAHWCEVRAAVSILTPALVPSTWSQHIASVVDMETWGHGQCGAGHNNKQGSTETTAHQHQAAAAPHPGGPASAWFTAAPSTPCTSHSSLAGSQVFIAHV